MTRLLDTSVPYVLCDLGFRGYSWQMILDEYQIYPDFDGKSIAPFKRYQIFQTKHLDIVNSYIHGFPKYESSYILLDGFSVLRTLSDSNFMVYEIHDSSVMYNAKVTFDFHTGDDSSWGTMPLFLKNNAHLFVPFELERMKQSLESKLRDMPPGLTKEERRRIILDIANSAKNQP